MSEACVNTKFWKKNKKEEENQSISISNMKKLPKHA